MGVSQCYMCQSSPSNQVNHVSCLRFNNEVVLDNPYGYNFAAAYRVDTELHIDESTN
jgi:hypothetical protein